jgi:hypothetical protein
MHEFFLPVVTHVKSLGFSQYFTFSETRGREPEISNKKDIDYYIYIITLKDIIPGFETI